MYAKWRNEAEMGLFALGFRPGAIGRLLSAATTLHRLSEVSCSVEVSDREQARMERREKSAEARVRSIVSEVPGASVDFQGDPRGCPFGVTVNGRTEYVPGRPFPAAVYARW
jgi:hypothetical protein